MVAKVAPKGLVVSTTIVVQVPAPAGERWKVTDSRPDWPSLAVALRASLPESSAPGSVSVTVGAVSSRRSATICATKVPEEDAVALLFPVAPAEPWVRSAEAAEGRDAAVLAKS